MIGIRKSHTADTRTLARVAADCTEWRLVHECPACGDMCDCDGEDHGQSAPDDCVHECDDEDEDDGFDDVLDGADLNDED